LIDDGGKTDDWIAAIQPTRNTKNWRKKTNKIPFVKNGASSKVFKFFLKKFEITVKIKIKKMLLTDNFMVTAPGVRMSFTDDLLRPARI
jgi:hypothetical protein